MEAAVQSPKLPRNRWQAVGHLLRSWLPWILGGCFIIWFTARDLLMPHISGVAGVDPWGHDFVNVWTGGHLVREGRFAALSNIAEYQAYQRQLFSHIGEHNYSYPPVTYPLAALLSLLPYTVALALWQVAGAGFFIYAAKPWWPRTVGPAWLAALTPAALMNIWAGHYGFFIGGLFLLGWRQVELGRPLRGGACFGLMLLKPHLAILVPLALAMKREWRAFAAATATVCALLSLTTAIYGWRPWHDFLFGTSRAQAALIDAGSSFFGTMSTAPATAVLSVGANGAVATIVQLLFVSGALWIVVSAALRDAPLRSFALLTSTATFMVLPYAFNYDLTVPMLGAVAVMAATRPEDTDWRLAFYGFIAPQFGMVLALYGVPLMPVMIAGLAVAQYRQCLNPKSVAGSEPGDGTLQLTAY
jgi:hypothetical protein